jgi:hypothetical protein
MILQKQFLAKLFLFFCLSISSALGQERPELKTVLSFLSPPFQFPAKKRELFLKSLSTFCEKAREDLPTNTPSEQDWVKIESATSDGKKLARLVQTVEFARYQLNFFYDDCVKQSALSIQANASGDRMFESAQLVALGLALNQDHDMKMYAKNAQFNDEESGVNWISTIRRLVLISAQHAVLETHSPKP